MSEIDLSEFGPIRSRRPGQSCWHTRLTPEQAAKADEAKRQGYAARLIAEVATTWGISIKQNAVHQHYLGNCACDRE